MEHFQKLKVANEILEYLNGNTDCGLFPIKPQMYRKAPNWRKGATLQSGVKEITITELMQLSDTELIDLQNKVRAAQKAKQAKTRNERYFLK